MKKRTEISHLSETIDAWMLQGFSQTKICELLTEEHGVRITARSLRRRLYELGVPPLNNVPQDSPKVRERIQAMFSQGLRDRQMEEILQGEGINITHRQLSRIRRKMNLHFRLKGSAAQAMDDLVQQKVQEELAAGGPAANLTREQMNAYMRSKYNIVGRDRIQRQVRKLNPEAVALRKSGKGRTKRLPPESIAGPAPEAVPDTIIDDQYTPLDPAMALSEAPYGDMSTPWALQ